MKNIFEQLSEQKKALENRIIRFETNLEHKIAQQDLAKKQAVELFGTADPAQLEEIIKEGQKKNRETEARLQTINDLVGNILTVLESGAEVPQHLVAELDGLLSSSSANEQQSVQHKPVKTEQQVVEKKSKPAAKEIQNTVQESADPDDLAQLEKAFSSLPNEHQVNPLDELVVNAQSHADQTSNSSSMFSENEVVNDDEIGTDFDVSEIGTLESMVSEPAPSQRAEEPIQSQPVKASFSF